MLLRLLSTNHESPGFSRGERQGDFTAGFVLADGGFPISFKDQYTPPAPTPGLYYKELAEGPGDPPHEVGNYVPLESMRRRIACMI